MKKFKIFLKTTLILLIAILITASLYVMISFAADNTTLVGAPTPIARDVTKAYSFQSSTYPRIGRFPITGVVFSSDIHYFCAQHGIPYGGQNKDNYLGDGYHISNKVTSNKWSFNYNSLSSYATSMTADIDANSKYYYIDKNITFHKPTTKFYGYKEHTETPADTAYTNWVYTSKDITFDCESSDADGAMAFLLARYLSGQGNNTYVRDSSNAKAYRYDPLQTAVWAWLGQLNGETNQLEVQGKAYIAYHKDSANPNVDVVPGDNVGTTLSGSTYVVGPFTMSNYVRAKNYSCPKSDGTAQTLQDAFGSGADVQGTIIKAEAIVSNGSSTKAVEFPVPEPNAVFNINLSASDISGYDELVDIVFTYQRVHASGNGTMYYGYQYKLSFSQDGASRDGSVSGSKRGCSSGYNCVSCYNDGHSWKNRSDAKCHALWCGGSGYCARGNTQGTVYSYGSKWSGCSYSWACGDNEHSHSGIWGSCYSYGCGKSSHSHSNSCYNSEGTKICGRTSHSHTSSCRYFSCWDNEHSHSIGWCGQYHSCSKHYCSHGHSYGHHGGHGYCGGKSWGASHADCCHADTLCTHGHTSCHHFTWKYDGASDAAQDGFSGSGTLVNEKIKYTIKVEVPLKTNMKIYKYISKVEHSLSGGTNDLSVADRSRWSMSQKSADSVKLERGDIVTYTIEIVNSSRFPTAVKVEDTLPSDCTVKQIDSRLKYKGASGGTNPASWIEVPANSTEKITVKVVTSAKSGTYSNIVEFITKNDTKEHMKAVLWGHNATHGTHSYSDIVNEDTSREKDADYYTIKEYDVSIDKYISNVKHKTNKANTFTGNRKNIDDESSKENNPVYVEFGDIVTYKIDIYNTVSPYLNAGTGDRTESPFWEPDIAYVNIQDILPYKYSELKVTVSNSTGTHSDNGGIYNINNIKVPAGGKVTVTVTLVVEEKDHTLDPICNNVTINGNVRNVNNKVITNHSNKKTSSDWYKLNNYKVSINKYISSYTPSVTVSNNNGKFTNETNEITDIDKIREKMTNTQKKDAPLQVEQTEKITYTIKVKNESTGSGLKKATQVRPTVIKDVMDSGLYFKDVEVKVKKADGSDKYSGTIPYDYDGSGTTHTFTFPDKIGSYYLVLDPGEYIEIKIDVDIVKSNMYLFSLKNTASIEKLTNINNESGKQERDITSENISTKTSSTEYVKLKDLVIAGKVWLDTDKDGYMGINGNGSLATGGNAIKVKNKPTTGVDETKEYAMEGIVVKLYEKDNPVAIRTTETDSNGFFTFGRQPDGSSYYSGTYKADATGVEESAQRIDKATNKDPVTKNYSSSSKLKEYYVEYVYDGLVYRSTAVYSDNKNLNNNGVMNGKYKYDSNAAEFEDVRDNFNKEYELISYNKGQASKTSEPHKLEFEKKGHDSYLKVDPDRQMTSRSFIDIGTNNTKYLWLYKIKSSTSYPETDYLKYINLGLELRDQFDLSLTKDLSYAQVRINGQKMDYEYNKLTEHKYYTNDEIYEMFIYNSDYMYRYDMYNNTEVQNYKRDTNTELEIDLTYKIRVYNESPDTVYAKINEVIDFNSSQMTFKPAKYEAYDKNKVVDAYMDYGGTKYELNVEPNSEYNTTSKYAITGYESNFITGMDKVVLSNETGKNYLDIYISYSVDKDTSRAILKDLPVTPKDDSDNFDKINIAQIGAYSTYKDAAATISFGIVDQDSNAGNLSTDGVVNVNKPETYEDNMFRSLLDIDLKDVERKITGMVFEDARNVEVSGKGNFYVNSTTWAERNFKLYTGNGTYNEGGDHKINIASKFEKMIESKNQDSNTDIALNGMTVQLVEIVDIGGKLYEETIDPTGNGHTVVRTEKTDKDGKYCIESYIPGTYLVRFRYGDILNNEITVNSLLHNGQDYKSTTYNLGIENSTDNDTKYNKLVEAGNSDARDNEFRRIEIMSYSEIMTNQKAEELKYTKYLGDRNINVKTEGNDKVAVTESVKKFSQATSGFADTVTVTLGVEQKEKTYNKEGKLVENPINTSTLTASMENIDFGVVFRPENMIELEKQIKNIKLTTSAGEVLVDIEYDMNGKKIADKAIGEHNVQSVDNIVSIDRKNITQGFRYINVDENILQGATLTVEYYLMTQNVGEVDVVDKKLFEENGSAAVLAKLNGVRNVIQSDKIVGKNEDGSNKTVKADNYIRLQDLFKTAYGIDYKYGTFLNDVYYKGASGNKATTAIVTLRVNKILDFIDNDATFVQAYNTSKDQYWVATSEADLLASGHINESALVDSYYVDRENRRYTTENKKNLTVNVATEAENPKLVKHTIPEFVNVSEDDYNAYIVVQMDAVLAGDNSSEDMVYDNVAEVIEFYTPAGRRTNFATTIGNLSANEDGGIGFKQSPEPDTYATEVIRLTPPTGATRFGLFLAGSQMTIAVIIMLVVVLVIALMGRKFVKDKIKQGKIYK